MADESHSALFGIAFAQPLILLLAAIIGVSISQRLGLGSVLGYLAAGVVIGPVARLITGAQDILQIAELGIVLFLFIIGLELKPARLWSMRVDIFGLGLVQVMVTGALLTAVFAMSGWRIEPAIIIGFGLAMSSTALCIQVLTERNELTTPYGQKATAILLFQDLAIVPLLALVALLAPGDAAFASSGLAEIVKVAAALAALLLAGRYLLNPLFRILALTRAREVMTAAALLVVLGAFRHELEADIEPFRSILLGLFFIAVGMSIRVDTILYSWWQVALAVPAVMLIKAAVIYGLARLFRASHNDAVRMALLLAQAGEFAFVLFASASAVRALWPSETSLVAGVVTLTMALTPFSLMLGRYLMRPEEPEPLEEDFEGAGGRVLVIGFGRFGQILAQVLLAQNVDATVLDANAERVREAARFGFRIYFGDGTRRDVLRSAGADRAAIICVCVDKPDVASRIADLVMSAFPNAKLYVRSWDRAHTLELLAKGVDYELRETYESAMLFGAETLRGLGVDAATIDTVLADVRRLDADRLALQLSGAVTAGRALPTPEPLIVPSRRGGAAAGAMPPEGAGVALPAPNDVERPAAEVSVTSRLGRRPWLG
jgi:CPA2 family monovalent cation:H+ antiporter-2